MGLFRAHDRDDLDCADGTGGQPRLLHSPGLATPGRRVLLRSTVAGLGIIFAAAAALHISERGKTRRAGPEGRRSWIWPMFVAWLVCPRNMFAGRYCWCDRSDLFRHHLWCRDTRCRDP